MNASRCLLVLAALLASLPADTVHFVNGFREPLEGEITSFQEAGIVVRGTVTLSGGQKASSTEQIPWNAIDHLMFSPLPGETTLLSNPGAAGLKDLEELWMAKLPHLKRPRSNAGDVGILFAERLLTLESEYPWERAMGIFTSIDRDDWNPATRARAKQGRLRTLIALGRIQEATREAVLMAEQSEDPFALLESRYVLATIAFNQLKELEKEHPRWMDDDEVRPKREILFHDALDLYLFAYLFHGSEEPAAARGLLGAAEVHRFAGDAVSAGHCAGDIVRLYPDTIHRPEAERFLEELSFRDNAPPAPR